ncbi:MAG: patatin-like phospholipase family protein [Hyphomicrobiales bacterium]
MGALLAGCASSEAWVSVPENLVDTARLPGYEEGIRFWGDERPPNLDKMVDQQIRQSLAYKKKYGGYGTLAMLSVSGGGADGAFGAGLLNGWTASGTRPKFDFVTGVSTGALTAPFAFLGPEFDDELKEVFTETSTKDVLRENLLGGLLGGTAIADSKPLYDLISKYATPEFIARVGKEHNNGRRLFIGSVNLEAERPVIWNMGKIANSKNPDKVELFRRVLLASAAIPGIFPPVTIEVVADGKKISRSAC